MKNKVTELDVDYIGGQRSLTKHEERQITELIKVQTSLRAKQQIHKTKTSIRKKFLA